MTKDTLDDLDAVRKVVDALEGFDNSHQERILRWAREMVGLGVEIPGASAVRAAPAEEAEQPGRPRGTLDVKSFVDAKNPKSDTHFAATVAYYYRFEAPEHLRRESINAQDLQEACRLVGRERLSRPAQTLVNTLAQGLLDRGERGAYTINTVGENLVAMALPTAAERVFPRKTKKRATSKSTKTKKAAAVSRRPKKSTS